MCVFALTMGIFYRKLQQKQSYKAKISSYLGGEQQRLGVDVVEGGEEVEAVVEGGDVEGREGGAIVKKSLLLRDDSKNVGNLEVAVLGKEDPCSS